MAIAFARSTLALEADRGRGARAALLIAIGLSCAWAGWFVFGKVTLVESATRARVEVHRAAHAVQAPVAGRVVGSQLSLGRRVTAGEVLIELDGVQVELERGEREARVVRLSQELAHLREQIAAQASSLHQQILAGPARLAQARANGEAAKAALAFAEAEAARAEQLQAAGAISDAQRLAAQREAATRRAACAEREAALDRALAEQRATESAERAELTRLEREAASVQGAHAEEQIAMQRLRQRIEDLRIKAPIAGVLGEVAALQVGSVLHEGDRVASVVPEGPLEVSALYAPERAVGRIAPGQSARVRLDGFPFTQFGSIPARVVSVGDEPIDGLVRVELALSARPDPRIPLQHGLPGGVLVEVEHIAPVQLLLRVTGKFLRDHAP